MSYRSGWDHDSPPRPNPQASMQLSWKFVHTKATLRMASTEQINPWVVPKGTSTYTAILSLTIYPSTCLQVKRE